MQVDLSRSEGKVRSPVLMVGMIAGLAASSVIAAQQDEHTEVTVTSTSTRRRS
jgi:hypothetical protein